MRLPLVVLVALALLHAAPSRAQTVPQAPDVREAYLAWDRGDYPRALRGYLDALEEASPERVREIAALTGEVYPVVEVASDGSGLAVGPEGRYATFERVTASGDPETRVVDATDGRLLATLPGFGAVPGPGGRIAYMEPGPVPPELPALLAAAEEARRAGDRMGYFARMREAAWYRVSQLAVRVHRMDGGPPVDLDLGGAIPAALAWDRAGRLLVSGATGDGAQGLLLRIADGVVDTVTTPDGFTGNVLPGPSGSVAVEIRNVPVLPTPPGSEISPRGATGLAVFTAQGDEVFLPGATDADVAREGSVLAWLQRAEEHTEVLSLDLSGDLRSRSLYSSADLLTALAVSPDGAHVAFQQRRFEDWDVFALSTSGSGEPLQLSDEIQHDRNPVWVDEGTVLAAKGEGRHMRSWLYRLDGAEPLKLFHNNTIRTIAPEYEWAPVPGGQHILVVSERDGDTVSPERGVYLVDRTRTVTRRELVQRLERALADEEELRRAGVATFAPIAEAVGEAVDEIQVERIHAYARELYRMGSKHITQPGNRRAIEYLEGTLRSWGYEPELQWFEPRPGLRTANVIVRVPGQVNPELVYVVSSHFDSVERGPGADDNSSGTTALLEVARVLRHRPMPATIELAFFTGEEAGLLGSREYVRRAVEGGKHIAGALNNDMLGWANDHRLDNTIRYSNPGIRDVQHAAAIFFSDLITYDALYYKSTDAAAYYEAYGDIVGGIGSYPVLGNPHYHQATDRLATINHRLVAEVARTTAASVMLLASAPARLRNLAIRSGEGATVVAWDAAPEADVSEYRVRWDDHQGAVGEATVSAGGGSRVDTRIPSLPPGSSVWVRAVNRRGHEGWDWARAQVPEGG